MPKMRQLCVLVMACLSGLAVAQSGEDEEDLALVYGDKDFISIATGNRQPIRNAPATATVITAADIEAMGATDLDEVLETVPGVHIARSASGYNPIYTFRGIYSQFNPHVLMLMNGVPMTSVYCLCDELANPVQVVEPNLARGDGWEFRTLAAGSEPPARLCSIDRRLTIAPQESTRPTARWKYGIRLGGP